MLAQYLVREDVLSYYRSLDQNAYAGRPSDRYECPMMQFLKRKVADLKLDYADFSFYMDFTHIWYSDGTIEKLPQWVEETVSTMYEMEFESLADLKIKDVVRVLDGSYVKEEKTFLFNELPEKIQDKLYQAFVESMDMTDCVEDTVADLEIELENELQGENISIRYSVGGGQGDGASFTGKMSIATFISDLTGSEKDYPLLTYVMANNDLYDDYVEIYSVNDRYAHSRSVKVSEVAVSGNATDIEDLLEDEISNLQEHMQEWIEDKSNEIYNTLQNEYDNLLSFERFKENEIDMENYYYLDGTLVE